jgi:hypothetical membrane protein
MVPMQFSTDAARALQRLPRLPRPSHTRLFWFTAVLTTLAVVGILYFFAAVTTAEALRPMYDPVNRTISELAVGRYGGIQISAFVALGLSLVALPAGLWQRVRRTNLSRLGIALIAVAGVASFIAAAFPTDLRGVAVATAAGEVHGITAGVGYGCLVAAMALLSLHFHRDHAWRPFRRLSAALTVAGVAALLAMAVGGDGSLAGLLQRLMVVPLLSWVLLCGLRAMRLPHPHAEA